MALKRNPAAAAGRGRIRRIGSTPRQDRVAIGFFIGAVVMSLGGIAEQGRAKRLPKGQFAPVTGAGEQPQAAARG
jgi:hypothetical protein